MTAMRPAGNHCRVRTDDAATAWPFAPLTDIYLGRQPIIDLEGALAGYELLFRQNHAQLPGEWDADGATAQVAEHTLASFGMSEVLGCHVGYINVGLNLLMSDAVESLPADRFVLEILEDVPLDDMVIERCRTLRAAGYRLALDDVTPARQIPEAMLDEIEIVKIDMLATGAEQLPATIDRFRRAGITVLAEKVETREAFERAAAFGCTLFQGYFFARPQVLATRKARVSGMPLLRLINLLHDDARVHQLEEALKATPDIVMQVFRLANAASGTGRAPLHTLSEAIRRVGTDRLARWVQLLLYAHGCNARLCTNPLVQMVGTRARFMELAAHHIFMDETDSVEICARAYLVGMLSLAHVLVPMNAAQIVDELRLASDIARAIEHHEGDLGALLACAEALETQNETAIAASMERWPALRDGAIARLGIEAAHWTVLHGTAASGCAH